MKIVNNSRIVEEQIGFLSKNILPVICILFSLGAGGIEYLCKECSDGDIAFTIMTVRLNSTVVDQRSR